MTQFQTRMQLATKRAIAYFGTVQFKWKNEGPPFSGNLGEEQRNVRARGGGGKSTEKRRDLVVLKEVHPETPVCGRVLTIEGHGVFEVDSFDQDVNVWTFHLKQAKQS